MKASAVRKEVDGVTVSKMLANTQNISFGEKLVGSRTYYCMIWSGG